ncbi:MAG: ABC transporter permease [Thermoguttaceae bacterium]|nr:ABC transporter permease [Thermoguttaceae bacterium]
MEDESREDSNQNAIRDFEQRDPNGGDWALAIILGLAFLWCIGHFLTRAGVDGVLSYNYDPMSYAIMRFGGLALVIGFFWIVFSRVRRVRTVFTVLFLACVACGVACFFL